MIKKLILSVVMVCTSLWTYGVRAQELTMRLNAEPATLDWNLARSSHETYILMNIMDGLIHLNTQTNEPEPALARSWKILNGGKTIIFEIKKGVLWTDKKELVAADFVYSWKRLGNPSLRAPYQNHLRVIKGFKAIGKYQLEVTLHSPSPQLLYLLSFWVTFPMRADLDPSTHYLTTLGPYRVTKWNKGKELLLEKNPQYSGSRKVADSAPNVVRTLIVSSDLEARDKLEKGDLDLFFEANTRDLTRAGPKARVEQFSYLATYYLGFNTAAAPFKSQKLRQAFSAVLDPKTQAQALQGGQQAAVSWLPPGILPDGIKPTPALSTDVQAQQLLAEEGFPAGRGFPSVELWIEKFDGAEKLASTLVIGWKKRLGVDVRARIAETALEFQKALSSGTAAFFVNHWGADFPDASNFFEVFVKGGPGHATGWHNSAYDLKVVDAGSTLDTQKRVRLYREAEEILVSQQAVIYPLFHKKNVVLVGPRVSHLHVSPLNYFEFNEVQMNQRDFIRP